MIAHEGNYADWLDVANAASRVASPEQRRLLRALALREHHDLGTYAQDIRKVMGWKT